MGTYECSALHGSPSHLPLAEIALDDEDMEVVTIILGKEWGRRLGDWVRLGGWVPIIYWMLLKLKSKKQRGGVLRQIYSG